MVEDVKLQSAIRRNQLIVLMVYVGHVVVMKTAPAMQTTSRN